MANQEYVLIIKQGLEAWNQWRHENPEIRPDLSNSDLQGINLVGRLIRNKPLEPYYRHVIDLRDVILNGANLSRAHLRYADLRGASLSKANLRSAGLIDAKLSHTCFENADLSGAALNYADLTNANLRNAILLRTFLDGARLIGASLIGADLTRASLIVTNLSYARLAHTNLEKATLIDCDIYGISVWNVKLEGAEQSMLRIKAPDQPTITVDNLEVAQFINLLVHNERIRHIIDTITSKVVLILGRFTDERLELLKSIREELRKHDYSPVLFDFDKPASRDITETVSTLAHMSRFVIADITEAKSIPQELQAIVPDLPSVPVQPILLESDYEYGMFEHFKKYPWVLGVHLYSSNEDLLKQLEEKVIVPAEKKARELTGR